MSEQIPFPVTPLYEGTDTKSLPFAEWSDAEYNSEKWDLGKVKDKGKGKSKIDIAASDYLFEDPQEVNLPPSILDDVNICSWKRPSEAFPEKDLEVYVETEEYPDLIKGSKHLLHSELIRSFISSVTSVQYLGNSSAFKMEGVTPTFTPTTDNLPWRPWHHIYSCCKAGKGQVHNPQVNQTGKYIVRLFWMGCWRKIYVDDKLPFDINSQLLLPSFVLPKIEPLPEVKLNDPNENTKDKKGGKKDKEKAKNDTVSKKSGKTPKEAIGNAQSSIQIWPYILSKAIFKLASLTWDENREIIDFDIVQCLTGWTPQRISTKDLNSKDIWEIVSAYGNRYSWSDDDKISNKTATSKSSKKTQDSTKESKSQSMKTDKSVKADDDDGVDGIFPNHVIVCCNDLRSMDSDEILDITPCWGHYFLIDQTRNIPLNKPEPWPELPVWKHFRWTDWAINQGILPKQENFEAIKFFKIVSCFRKYSGRSPPSKHSLDILKSVNEFNNIMDTEKGHGKEAGKKDEKNKQVKDMVEIPDIGIWVDFEKLSEEINCIILYFKPSKFENKIKISDLNITENKSAVVKGKGGKDSQKDWKNIVLPTNVQDTINQPLYMFIDSIDVKYLLFNISQTGNKRNLDKKITFRQTEIEEVSEDNSCFNLIKRYKKKNTTREVICEETITFQKKHKKPISCVIVEKYNWKTDKNDEAILYLQTFGSKSLILELGVGRFLLKLWIKSHASYDCHILSDTKLTVGFLEEILVEMTSESETFLKACFDISSSYGKLVQSFGMPEFLEELRNFYCSYKPTQYTTKKELLLIHKFFYQIFIDQIKTNFDKSQHKTIIRAVEILFRKIEFNPTYRICEFENIDDTDLKFYKLMERSACKIQALFKGVYVRSILQRHVSEHKEYLLVFEQLKKIYLILFSTKNRTETCTKMMRNFLYNPIMYKIKHKYNFYSDIQSVVTLNQYSGSINVKEDEWILLCRYVFYITNINPVLVKINLFCSIGKYMVRVFDNDTNEEIKRLSSNVAMHAYKSNIKGYTVLCYSCPKVSIKCFWKIIFITLKRNLDNLLLVPPVTLQTQSLIKNYIPNSKNQILRYFIKIGNDTIITARLLVSFNNALISLRLLDDKGKLIQEIFNKEKVLLPAIYLEQTNSQNANIPESRTELNVEKTNLPSKKLTEKSSRSSKGSIKKSSIKSMGKKSTSIDQMCFTTYIIEGVVHGNSWPLSADEWHVVENLQNEKLFWPTFVKETGTSIGNSFILSEPGKGKSKMKMSDTSVIDSPYWLLQIIYNTTDSVQVSKDVTEEEEIKNVKRKWYESDINRYNMSNELRKAYLYTINPTESLLDVPGAPSELLLSAVKMHRYSLPKIFNIEDLVSIKSIKGSLVDTKKSDSVSIRSLSSPFSASLCTSEFSLKPYRRKTLRDIDQYDRKVKTESDFIEDEEKRQEIIKEYNEKLETLIQNMSEIVAYKINACEKLNDWYKGIRKESKFIMESAYNKRQKYIDSVIRSIQQTQEQNESLNQNTKKKK